MAFPQTIIKLCFEVLKNSSNTGLLWEHNKLPVDSEVTVSTTGIENLKYKRPPSDSIHTLQIVIIIAQNT